MKTIRNLLLLTTLCMCTISCSAQRTLADVSKIEGVSSFYIGRPMLRMVGAISLGETKAADAIDLSALLKNIDSVEVIDCDSDKSDEVMRACDETLSKFPFEVLTIMEEGNDKIEVRGVMKEDDTCIKMLQIKILDGDFTNVLLKGNFTAEDIAKALK